MFLSRVQVENFRGIVRLDLDLGKTTVLIGENAAGKTSVLDLLSMCLGHHNDDGAVGFCDSDFHRAGRNPSDEPPPIQVRLNFAEREPGDWDALSRLQSAFFDSGNSTRNLTLQLRADKTPAGIATSYWFSGIDGKPLGRQPDPSTLAYVRELSPFLLIRADRGLPARAEADASVAPRDARELALEKEISRVYELLVAADALPPREELRRGLSAVATFIGEDAERVFQDHENRERALEQLVERPVAMSIHSGPELEANLQGAGARSVALLLMVGAILEARGPATISPDAAMILAIEEPEVHQHPLMLAAVWSVIESLRAQKIVTTNSGNLLSSARLGMLRRLVRRPDKTDAFSLDDDTLSLDEMRKVTYHIRLKRDDALFARAWLLVEGETEVWLLPELARLVGCDFPSEGISIVDFAQAGVEPLVKLANALGIEWHLVADGDTAGHGFVQVAERYLAGASRSERISVLGPPDIEHCLWDSGYSYVYHSIARGRSRVSRTAGKKSRKKPSRVIDQAIRNSSKPHLALTVVEQAAEQDSPGVPRVLRSVIDKTLELALLGVANSHHPRGRERTWGVSRKDIMNLEDTTELRHRTDTAGKFVRLPSEFRDAVTADGSSGYRAESGRYHLYVSYACPWAHRAIIVRRLKRLEDVVGMTVVDPIRDARGWKFSTARGCETDPINGFEYLSEAYLATDPAYASRVTVPVLWDKRTSRVVNNESSEIIRMLNAEFAEWGDNDIDLYPAQLADEIDELNAVVYTNVNNGVYKCGFARSQTAYEASFVPLFETLDTLDERLASRRYLMGDTVTEADWRLFTTLVRFDAVYVGHFKCNKRRIADYDNLSGYLRELYRMPRIAETVDMDHIKRHYYMTHGSLNPSGIVPRGPQLDFDAPHGRG